MALVETKLGELVGQVELIDSKHEKQRRWVSAVEEEVLDLKYGVKNALKTDSPAETTSGVESPAKSRITRLRRNTSKQFGDVKQHFGRETVALAREIQRNNFGSSGGGSAATGTTPADAVAIAKRYSPPLVNTKAANSPPKAQRVLTGHPEGIARAIEVEVEAAALLELTKTPIGKAGPPVPTPGTSVVDREML
jgi:hypothetical protein